jgi:hypothetical protein
LQQVLSNSRGVALNRYEMPPITDLQFSNAKSKLGRNGPAINSPQTAHAIDRLLTWRDKTARILDESTEYVMRLNVVKKIAHSRPSSREALLGSVNSHCASIVRQHADDILAAIHGGPSANEEQVICLPDAPRKTAHHVPKDREEALSKRPRLEKVPLQGTPLDGLRPEMPVLALPEPAGPGSPFFANDSLLTQTSAFWETLSQRTSDEPEIIKDILSRVTVEWHTVRASCELESAITHQNAGPMVAPIPSLQITDGAVKGTLQDVIAVSEIPIIHDSDLELANVGRRQRRSPQKETVIPDAVPFNYSNAPSVLHPKKTESEKSSFDPFSQIATETFKRPAKRKQGVGMSRVFASRK